MRWLWIIVTAVSCGGTSTPMPVQTSQLSSAPIEWSPWSAEAFDRARQHSKMVLVDVGIEGCTACRWMYEDTYRNPEVVSRINEHFVAIAVDANQRPDIGQLYSRWGWPATIVFSPDGTRVLAIRGNKRPRNFIPILDQLIERQGRGALVAESSEPVAEPEPDEQWDTQLCQATTRALSAKQDETAGWMRALTLVRGAPLEHAFVRSWAYNDEELGAFALRTAEAYAALLDPVWGGVFVAGRGSRLIVEKRTRANAAAMIGFAHALARTGDESWLRFANEVHRYMKDWMTSPEGTFYATQEDDAPDLPSSMSARDYYQLDDEHRRNHGIPPIDHGVYGDLNGRMIYAYTLMYEASRQSVFLEAAQNAARGVLQHQHEEGWIPQTLRSEARGADERMRAVEESGLIFLAPQARMGLALLALFRATGDVTWLGHAIGVADATIRGLALDSGAFASAPPDGTESIVTPQPPVEDNAVMARFLLMLASTTQNQDYKRHAQAALEAVAPRGVEGRGPVVLAELALATLWHADGPIEMSIVADPGDPAAQPFLEASQALWEPRKIVHFEPDGRYPRQEAPIVHICSHDACSSPIQEPSGLADTLAQFRRANGPC